MSNPGNDLAAALSNYEGSLRRHLAKIETLLSIEGPDDTTQLKKSWSEVISFYGKTTDPARLVLIESIDYIDCEIKRAKREFFSLEKQILESKRIVRDATAEIRDVLRLALLPNDTHPLPRRSHFLKSFSMESLFKLIKLLNLCEIISLNHILLLANALELD